MLQHDPLPPRGVSTSRYEPGLKRVPVHSSLIRPSKPVNSGSSRKRSNHGSTLSQISVKIELI